MRKTLLVFTGGGLAPALNPTLYGVIMRARQRGFRILGGLSGWASLSRPGGRVVDLTRKNVSSIRDRGGTFLRSSRTNPLVSPESRKQLLASIQRYALDGIIVIGGDDTLGAAARVVQQFDLPIIGIPKTIDNDLPGTYWAPGFPSAAHYLASLTREIRIDAAYSLGRVFLIESQGRDTGWLAAAASLGGADAILVPEKRGNLSTFLTLLEKKYRANGGYATVVVAEEANFTKRLTTDTYDLSDDYRVKRQLYVSLTLRSVIQNELGLDTKVVMPSNYYQTGDPIPADREMAIVLGKRAVDAFADGETGVYVGVHRPSWKKRDLTVRIQSLGQILNKPKPRLTRSFFNFSSFTVSKKYLEYLAPARITDSPSMKRYQRLIQPLARLRKR